MKFIFGVISGVVTWFLVVSIPQWAFMLFTGQNDQLVAALCVLLVGPFLGWVVGVHVVPNIMDNAEAAARKAQAEAEQRQQEYERRERESRAQAARQKEAAEREIAAKAAERTRNLTEISRLVTSAKKSASRLPIQIAEAELALDKAEQELAEGLYSPFWEAMEHAATQVGNYDRKLRGILDAREQHCRLAPPLAPDAEDFSLGISILPDPAETIQRMNALYRQAQKDPHFAQVYEQRRINATLIEGFRSLGDAVSSLGGRLEFALRSLRSHLDYRLADVTTVLRESADRMQEQQSALLAEAESARHEAREANSELTTVAREAAEQSAVRAEKEAASRRKHEAETREMLDNIQRRRKPFPPMVGDGVY